MDRMYAELRPGARFDIDVEFITKRPIDCGGTTVTRLLVTDQAGEQFAVLVAPDRASLPYLETGATYRLSGLLGAQPVDSARGSAEECPDCGGPLRVGRVVDTAGSAVAAAASQLGVDEPFGIVDATTVVQTIADDADDVDDWTPMRDEQVVEPPDFVCDACGSHIDEIELRDMDWLDNEMNAAAAPTASADMASPETVGLAAGGAKDVTNFRENVAEGFTPQPEAISDEGLFYDYYFETGERTATEALFAPRYAAAVSEHPLTGDTEQYLSVGLDSTLSVAEFERPRLDLVAVLDVSGSMDSPFDEYYYDEQGRERAAETGGETKLSAATQSLCALTEQLHAEDRLGVVLYNHRAHVAKPLRDVGATDMPAIRRHIREIKAGGGTNLEDGFEAAIDMLVEGTSGRQVERRVVFMTDMMPNTGATDEGALTDLFADAAAEGIHTTFIGMGLDANADLADALSGIRGANHYFVHSADEFEQRLGEEFDYMVSPLVYNLTLELNADGYEVEAVHGSPSADAAHERLMHVGTLFPSAKQDGETRGGVVLVRLDQQRPDADLELVASWTERDGSEQREQVSVSLPDAPETFSHAGVRKAVVLARYARELRTWAQDIHARAGRATGVDDWLLTDQRGQHERESVGLVVPDDYADRFARLRAYLATEKEALADDSLDQELALLDTLCQEVEASPEVAE
jgi:Ca-activated chloride channel family protein